MFTLEYRNGMWFVVDTVDSVELATVFYDQITANEICSRVNAGERFFQHIPRVPYRLGFPRPDKC